MSRSALTDPLRIPAFRYLWLSGGISNLGTMVQTVGAGWLMATIATSADMVALVQAAMTLPVMLFSIASGVLADSYDRRRILMVAQILMMSVAVILATLAASGQITPPLLLGLTFLLGCGTALHTPSWQASVGDVVERGRIPAAVTLNSMALNLTRSVGPAVGGLVVASAGAAAAFAINAASFLPMIVALALWRKVTAQESLPREGFGRAAASGLRYVSMSPNLLSVIARGFIFGLTAIVILALLPLVARDLLGGGAVTYGLLLGAFGIGALGGGVLNARLRAAFSAEAIIRTAFVGLSASAAATALSPSPWLTCLVLLPAGGCWVLALSLFNIVVQLSTPRWVVGRVLSLYQTASFAGMTLGAWLWGLAAEGYSTSGALLAASFAGLLGAALGLLRAMPELVALNLDPLNRFEEPPLQIDLTARSGPIMILLEYDIAAEDVPDFLRAMADRRRIRLRDGARQWVLLRDLENPRLWKEAYHVPTWVEYVRHNRRRTQVDAEVSERLAALNGGRKPQVRRMIERHTIPAQDDVALKAGPMLP